MKIITLKKDILIYRSQFASNDIGLVPTMGNLHRGHLSLIEKSLKNHDLTIISIFINPLQFGPHEDFEKYPKTLADDCQKIKDLKTKYPTKKIIIYAPATIDEIYPSDFGTIISVNKLSQILCGKSRPHHFDGVTTIVYQLFSTIRPKYAYFGQKDYQQFKIISQMTRDLNLPVQLISLPIIRDSSGLALSSRNQYLSPDEKQQALHLPHSLREAAQTLLTQGTKAAQQWVEQKQRDKKWDYLHILQQDSLNTATPGDQAENLIILGAIKIGETRLIDNLALFDYLKGRK